MAVGELDGTARWFTRAASIALSAGEATHGEGAGSRHVEDVGIDKVRGTLVRALATVVAIVAVCSISFLGAATLRLGHLPSFGSEAAAPSGMSSLRAGDLEFTYGKGWARAATRNLPTDIGGGPGTRIVGGLCPGGCSSGVAVTYVTFGADDGNFPDLGELASGFDASFPTQFTGFRRIAVQNETTGDGIRYLRYEFTYRDGKQPMHEILAAYPVGGHGVLVMARGPESDFASHRGSVVAVLGDARIAS